MGFWRKNYELSFLILKYHWYYAFLLSAVVCGPLDISSNPYICLIFEQQSLQQLELMLAASQPWWFPWIHIQIKKLYKDVLLIRVIPFLESAEISTSLSCFSKFFESKNRFVIYFFRSTTSKIIITAKQIIGLLIHNFNLHLLIIYIWLG